MKVSMSAGGQITDPMWGQDHAEGDIVQGSKCVIATQVGWKSTNGTVGQQGLAGKGCNAQQLQGHSNGANAICAGECDFGE